MAGVVLFSFSPSARSCHPVRKDASLSVCMGGYICPVLSYFKEQKPSIQQGSSISSDCHSPEAFSTFSNGRPSSTLNRGLTEPTERETGIFTVYSMASKGMEKILQSREGY